MLKKNKLMQKPAVQEKFAVAVHNAEVVKQNDPTVTGIRDLIKHEEIRDVMEDILDTSPMSEPQKTYIRAVFIDKMPKRKAITKAFGRDLGYQEEAIVGGIMESPAVKEFVDLIKQFYISVTPIAALKEVEIMLNPRTDPEFALKAAKQIKEAAGVGVDERRAPALPVKLVINMPPVQNNIQVNVPKEATK